MTSLSAADWVAIWLTVKLSLVTTLILLILAMPLAWLLARWQHPAKYLVQAIIMLPLVLPPTVLGFYLLVVFAPDSVAGQLWQMLFGSTLAFTFSGLVFGSVIFSLPFAVQPLYTGFKALAPEYLETAKLLGMPPVTVVWKIILPLLKPFIIVAAGLCFAHTMGEFGVVLMLGGSIPGETQVLSIMLFNHVEGLRYTQAHWLAFIMLMVSLLLLSMLFWVGRFRRAI
ncbi:molybdate ABC transporter permease subunit [Alteromonas ponticola]|uniref:molybdate ABC transporter permease subunit n=1 Tax=Alteromonas ponticola TaxID=2720613 RepID=UPI001FE8AC94|nr:molybdate ABC transporter permease subunit [Alteromonas ponticola]